jgi:4-amino-4-deoxy-L-arabinose transferase-like glycosyltransferase
VHVGVFGSTVVRGDLMTRNATCLIFGALLVLVFTGALRVVALDADPPPSMSSDIASDEAWWAHNARNRTLFGKWVLDDFNQGLFAAPLHTAMARLSFAVGGVSLKQTRMVSALSGLGTISLVGLILWRALGFWSGLAGMVILASDYLMLSYDRTGFVEPLPVFLMTLASALTLVPRDHAISLFLAGVVAVLAMFGKANSIFFVPVPFVFLLMRRVSTRTSGEMASRRIRSRALAVYVAGVSLCFAAWLFAFVLPNWAEYKMQNGRLQAESRIADVHLLFNIFSIGLVDTNQGVHCLSILTMALLPVGLASVWAVHNGIMVWRRGLAVWLARLTDLERFSLAWLAMFLPYFVLNNNGADRRYYVFLIPLTILGVHVLVRRRRELVRFDVRRRSGWAVPSIVAALILTGIPVIFYLRPPIVDWLAVLTKDIAIGRSLGLNLQPLSALATAILVIGFLPIAPLAVRSLRATHFRVGHVAMLALVVLLPLQLYREGLDATAWSFTLARTAEKARSVIGDDARVIDGSGIIMGTRCRNLILLDRRWVKPGYPDFGRALIPSFRPTHLTIPHACTESQFAEETLRILDGWGRYVPGTMELYPFFLNDKGEARFVSSIGRIEPVEKQ